jgi:Cell division protein FtsQ
VAAGVGALSPGPGVRAARPKAGAATLPSWLGRVGRWPVLLAIALVGALVYLFVLPRPQADPRVILPTATSTIGSGEDAVAVSADGEVGLPEEVQLPRLPLATVPEKPLLGGPLLEQARVLGAAPAALRPYIESSYYGESGVDVELRSGIELRFGDASRAEEKWQAAAAILADPSIEALDYVDLHSPRRPAVRGSGYTLPPLP